MCLGTPGRITEIVDAAAARALVDVSGRGPTEVSIAMLQAGGDLPAVGDWVVVHVGLAMSIIDEDEAKSIIADLQQLEDLYRDFESPAEPAEPAGDPASSR